MYGFMSWQWFEARSRAAAQSPPLKAAPVDQAPATPPQLRIVAINGLAPVDGRCCFDQRLELEPCYPYSADWRLRCRGCGRWHSPGIVAAVTAPPHARAPSVAAD